VISDFPANRSIPSFSSKSAKTALTRLCHQIGQNHRIQLYRQIGRHHPNRALPPKRPKPPIPSFSSKSPEATESPIPVNRTALRRSAIYRQPADSPLQLQIGQNRRFPASAPNPPKPSIPGFSAKAGLRRRHDRALPVGTIVQILRRFAPPPNHHGSAAPACQTEHRRLPLYLRNLRCGRRRLETTVCLTNPRQIR